MKTDTPPLTSEQLAAIRQYNEKRCVSKSDVDALLAAVARLQAENVELAKNNESQGRMIGGYIAQISAAKETGISFSWEGPTAIASNDRAERLRPIVAGLAAFKWIDEGYDYCVFCRTVVRENEPHTPDCPYRLAQEAMQP